MPCVGVLTSDDASRVDDPGNVAAEGEQQADPELNSDAEAPEDAEGRHDVCAHRREAEVGARFEVLVAMLRDVEADHARRVDDAREVAADGQQQADAELTPAAEAPEDAEGRQEIGAHRGAAKVAPPFAAHCDATLKCSTTPSKREAPADGLLSVNA